MFAIGEVVRLKSGGPPMTVAMLGSAENLMPGAVYCTWFSGNPVAMKQENAWFDPTTLERA